MNSFYTYAYLRKDGTPYYIGKGKKYRIYSKNKTIKPPKDKSQIIFLKQNLTEEEAFKHERYMISLFGRKDLGTGILHNRTDGGEGVSNFNFSEETRKKMAESAKKRYANMTPEQRKEIGNKIREGQSRMSLEQRNKISEALKKGNLKLTSEQRSEIARKREARKTLEQRKQHSESIKKWAASRTPEQRSESAKKREANLPPGLRREGALKRHKSKTPEQRKKEMRKVNSLKFQCTVTGYISNFAGLLRYQKKRGIDTSKRVRLN